MISDPRQAAGEVAATDLPEALRRAREQITPWYSIQALGWVARYAPEQNVDVVAKEAFNLAWQSADRYQTVAAAAWPIRALIERGHLTLAADAIRQLVGAIGEIAPEASRAAAIELLWDAAFPAGASIRAPILQALRAHLVPEVHWRARRAYRDIALTLASEDRGQAEAFVDAMPEGEAKEKSRKALAESAPLKPRPFFWNAA